MKKFKGTIFLGIILVAIAVYAYVFEVVGARKKEEAEKNVNKVFHFKKLEVEELLIKRQNEEMPEILLQKIGGIWYLKKPLDYKADDAFVTGLINNIDVIENKRTVTEDVSDLSKFGLDPPQAVYYIKDKDGADTLYLGNKNPIGNYTFAMKPARDKVFLTYNAMLDKSGKEIFEFRNKSVLDIETEQINRLYLKAPKRNFEAVREAANRWELKKPITESADKAEIDKILNKVKNARIKEFVDEDPKNLRKYGLHRPAITLDLIRTADESKQTLYIGKAKDGDYYAKTDSRKPVYLVDSTLYNRLLPKLFMLRDKSVINSKSTEVRKLEIIYSDTTIICEKDSVNEWFVNTPEKGKGINWKINGIISDLEYLKVEEFLTYNSRKQKSYGLTNAPVQIIFSSRDTVIERIKLGKKAKEQRYFYNGTRNKLYLVGDRIYNALKVHVKDLLEETVEEEKKEN